jgi:hypothetical protein
LQPLQPDPEVNVTERTIKPDLPEAARRFALLNAPKARALLQELEQMRVELEMGHVIRPTYTEALASPDILQIVVGETLSGWDFRSERPDVDVSDERLLGVIRDLEASQAARWWWQPLDRARQVVLSHEPIESVLARSRSLAEMYARSELVSGLMVNTSTWVNSKLPAALLTNPGHMARQPPTTKKWHVEVHASAKVIEIRSPADYLDLCERYPLSRPTTNNWREHGVQTPRVLSPAWSRVREEWDGVHVSVSGHLTATGIPVRLGSHTAIWIEVDSEHTTWFTNALTAAEEITVS